MSPLPATILLLFACQPRPMVEPIDPLAAPKIGITATERGQNSTIIEALERAGAAPRILVPPLEETPAAVLAGLDALVLGGGADLDPARYRESAHDAYNPEHDARQVMDLDLAEAAISWDIPLLGICLGAQELVVVPGSPLADLYPQAEILVNSLHHQAVEYHPEQDATDEGLHAAPAQDTTTEQPWGHRCGTVYNPLVVQDRRSRAQLETLVTSRFGDGRRSYVPGHLHAGIDLRTGWGEIIHAICPGQVVDIHLSFPHLTVVVEHHTPDGEVFWSSYKHVADVQVEVGDDVEEITPIARAFDTEELSRAGWRSNHLHFEIRTSIEDEGTASFTSMTMEELTRYAADPLVFFRGRLVATPPTPTPATPAPAPSP